MDVRTDNRTADRFPFPWSMPATQNRIAGDLKQQHTPHDHVIGPGLLSGRAVTLSEWLSEFRDERTGGLCPPPMQ